MKPLSKIVKDHLGHNLTTNIEDGKLSVTCLDCNDEIYSEMFDPETCIVSILTRESVNEAVCEMDISEEDQEKVMASIGENIIEELAENMGDCSCCNELFDEALQLELGRVAEDVIDGFKSEFHEDLPGNNKQQTEIA